MPEFKCLRCRHEGHEQMDAIDGNGARSSPLRLTRHNRSRRLQTESRAQGSGLACIVVCKVADLRTAAEVCIEFEVRDWFRVAGRRSQVAQRAITAVLPACRHATHFAWHARTASCCRCVIACIRSPLLCPPTYYKGMYAVPPQATSCRSAGGGCNIGHMSGHQRRKPPASGNGAALQPSCSLPWRSVASFPTQVSRMVEVVFTSIILK